MAGWWPPGIRRARSRELARRHAAGSSARAWAIRRTPGTKSTAPAAGTATREDECGILEEGCLHLVCRSCGYSEVVAFSCKKRGFCPGCLGRRMADAAVHLEERVLPRVPVRHWVCSLPWGLRALLGYDRELCAKVVSAFVGELFRSLAKRAKRELGLSSVRDAHAGAVCAVQRADGALRLNVHMHVLALDGVYVRDVPSGKLEFHELGTPTRKDVGEVARRTAERIEKLLRKAGRSLDPSLQSEAAQPALELGEPGLASCYARGGAGHQRER